MTVAVVAAISAAGTAIGGTTGAFAVMYAVEIASVLIAISSPAVTENRQRRGPRIEQKEPTR